MKMEENLQTNSSNFDTIRKPMHIVKHAKNIANKIYKKDENLPAFTLFAKTDKSEINRAKFNLYSLLTSMYDKKMSMDDFKDTALSWNKITGEK